MRPRDLPDPAKLIGPVHWDVESSGLYPDDGARISSVGVAWAEIPTGGARRGCWEHDGTGGLPHPIGADRGCGRCRGTVRKAAFPFAQGRIGKAEDSGQAVLFGEGIGGSDPNLSERDWIDLLDWLEAVGRSWPDDRRLVAHNAGFDLIMTEVGTLGRPGVGQPAWRGRDLSRWAWCSQVLAKELWPRELAGLDAVGERLFGARGKKAKLKGLGPKSNPRYDLVEWGEGREGDGLMCSYILTDVDIGLLVANYELDLLDQGMGVHDWIERETELMGTLVAMEQRGLPYATRESLEIARQLEVKQERLAWELPFKPTGDAAKKFFFTDRESVVDRPRAQGGRRRTRGLNLVPYSVTEKGAPQLTEEHVTRLVGEWGNEEPGRIARLWQQWNKLDTARSMWYSGYAEKCGPDGRLRTRFNQFGTRSARYSVSRVNLQAIPHEWRLGGDEGPLAGLVSPRGLIAQAVGELPGWGLYEIDLAQAELRVAALWAECQTMLRLIREGEDLHGYTARALFPGAEPNQRDWGFKRGVIGKRANFTLLFGAGWRRFLGSLTKEGVETNELEVQRWHKLWNAEYPEYGRANDRWARFVERRKYIPLANGRRRWFASWELSDSHKGFNARVQGSLAELGKDWLRQTERICRAAELDKRGQAEGVGRGGLILAVHDSVWLLLPDDCSDELIEASRAVAAARWEEMFPGVPGGTDVKRLG